jgi:hypothetical protein
VSPMASPMASTTAAFPHGGKSYLSPCRAKARYWTHYRRRPTQSVPASPDPPHSSAVAPTPPTRPAHQRSTRSLALGLATTERHPDTSTPTEYSRDTYQTHPAASAADIALSTEFHPNGSSDHLGQPACNFCRAPRRTRTDTRRILPLISQQTKVASPPATEPGLQYAQHRGVVRRSPANLFCWRFEVVRYFVVDLAIRVRRRMGQQTSYLKMQILVGFGTGDTWRQPSLRL